MSWFDDNNPEAAQRLGGADPSTVNAPPGIVPGHVLQTGQVYAGTGGPNTTPYIGTTTADGSVNYQKSPFSKTSTSADLLAALNKAGAAPGSAQATALTKQYTDALGISGNALQAGFSAGQYDPTRSKIYLPGTDLKYDNGQWGDHPYSASDASDPSSANALDSSLLAPYTKTFDYQPFQAPNNITEQNDPGFQSRLQLGQQALERSAAAKGTLLTGGTAKDLQSFGQNFASNEYGQVYGRAANDYNTNRNNAYQQYLGDESTFYANQNNPFAKLLSLSTLDSQNNIANGQLGLGYANLNSNNINASNNLNFEYANAGANNLTNGANAYGNYTTQAGNAGAAGSIAGGNAWQNAFAGAGNTALGAYYNNLYPPNQRSPYNSPGAGNGYP